MCDSYAVLGGNAQQKWKVPVIYYFKLLWAVVCRNIITFTKSNKALPAQIMTHQVAGILFVLVRSWITM